MRAHLRTTGTGLLLLATLWCAAASAQDARPLRVETLTVVDAVQVGVSRNLATLSDRLLLDRQRQLERAAWQPYSPTLLLDANVARTRAGVDPFGREALLSWSAGVFWRAPVGTVLSAEGIMTQGLGNPAGDNLGALVVGITQPLLKNAWLTGAALPLREADFYSRIQRELYRQSLNALIADLETAYWDLALAEADVVIKKRSIERARQQYEDTAENIRRGILAPIDIYVVEENVVFFEQELLQTEENVRRARARMAELLAADPSSPMVPTQPLQKPTFTVPDRDEVIAAGLTANPRIHAQRYRHGLAQLRQAYAYNQALPSVDLSASLSMLGSDPRYTGAWQRTLADPRPEARVGISVAVPLDRGSVSAQVEGAQLDLGREAVELQSVEQQVRYEIINGITELDTNLKLLAMAEKQVELGELKLNAETEKYKSGISTLADVVRFQRDLDNALIRLQRVIRSVHVGRVRLLASQGNLHEVAGVALQ